jgi:cell wall-associated NlpC family hydrolase
MAAAALAYGPRTDAPRPGDLVVIRTRRGPAGHVGVIVAELGGRVEIVSGNWHKHVARAWISRGVVTAFVRV